jgi:copper(I)-binding protein
MRWLLFALGLAALPIAASAHEITLKSLKIVHPWVYETEERHAVLHLKIRNTSDAAERLLSATSTVAEGVSILDAHGEKTTGVPIPARGEVSLRDGGPRLFLNGLKKPLRAYDSFDVVLAFRDAGQVTIEVLVEEADAPNKQRSGG